MLRFPLLLACVKNTVRIQAHPLLSHYQGGQLNLNSAELIHLIGRFNHINLRPDSCTMSSKDVHTLKEKLLNEYYIKVQGRGY